MLWFSRTPGSDKKKVVSIMDSYLELLRECRHPHVRVRLQALETLYKEHLDRVEPDFLLLMLRKSSRASTS